MSDKHDRHPAEMFLKLLLNSKIIEHKGKQYALDKDLEFCYRNEDAPLEKWWNYPISIGQIIKLADEIGRDKLWLQCCELELQKARSE